MSKEMRLSDVLQAMLDSGCTAEQIVAVVKTVEHEQEQKKAIKRQKDTDRQKRYRAMSRNVTRDNVLHDVTECDIPDKEKSPHTPLKEINPVYTPLYPDGYIPPKEKTGKISESEKKSDELILLAANAVVEKKKTPRKILETVLSQQKAADIIEHRQKLRKPLSTRAAELLAKKFADAHHSCGMTAEQAADFMIDRGWQGFELKWVNNSAQNGSGLFPSQPAPVFKTDDTAWQRRLDFARDRKIWSTAEWGPMPGKPECRVPMHLLVENDGKEWQEQERTN